MRPLRGHQETRVATREESGVLCFPSRRGLTPRVPGSVDPSDQKKTACYDIDVEVEEPLKGQMSSFLLSTANQQEISALDSKVGLEPGAATRR